MKLQKSVIFIKKNLKINMWKIKLEIVIIIQEKHRVVVHIIYILKYSLPKKIPLDFDNGSNYNYYFIIEELA